jgi:hypothetical protein
MEEEQHNQLSSKRSNLKKLIIRVLSNLLFKLMLKVSNVPTLTPNCLSIAKRMLFALSVH